MSTAFARIPPLTLECSRASAAALSSVASRSGCLTEGTKTACVRPSRSRARPPLWRVFRIALVFCVTAFGSTPVFADTPSRESDTDHRAPLSVNIVNLRSNKGRVGCTIYDKAKGFPTDATVALRRLWCPIASQKSSCRFDSLLAGTYAVACFHDENANGKLDSGLFGIPTEGVVVSNQAKGFMGPPKFDAAKFRFAGAPSQITLKMEY